MGGCGSKNAAGKKNFLIETMAGHEKGINCMALSEDGSVLATGSEDKTARLWSTKTHSCECIGILRGHEEYINCILIEDCYVLTGSADKTIRKWDVSTCECVLICRGHTSIIYRMICTGDFIFTSSYDCTARCWDFENGECLRVFRGHKKFVCPLIFIPADDDDVDDTLDMEGANDLLITGSADATARKWNFETGKCLHVFKGHDSREGAIMCMATDSLGRILFTGSGDKTIRSWNLSRGEQLKVFEGHTGSVICMQVCTIYCLNKCLVYLIIFFLCILFYCKFRLYFISENAISPTVFDVGTLLYANAELNTTQFLQQYVTYCLNSHLVNCTEGIVYVTTAT